MMRTAVYFVFAALSVALLLGCGASSVAPEQRCLIAGLTIGDRKFPNPEGDRVTISVNGRTVADVVQTEGMSIVDFRNRIVDMMTANGIRAEHVLGPDEGPNIMLLLEGDFITVSINGQNRITEESGAYVLTSRDVEECRKEVQGSDLGALKMNFKRDPAPGPLPWNAGITFGMVTYSGNPSGRSEDGSSAAVQAGTKGHRVEIQTEGFSSAGEIAAKMAGELQERGVWAHLFKDTLVVLMAPDGFAYGEDDSTLLTTNGLFNF